MGVRELQGVARSGLAARLADGRRQRDHGNVLLLAARNAAAHEAYPLVGAPGIGSQRTASAFRSGPFRPRSKSMWMLPGSSLVAPQDGALVYGRFAPGLNLTPRGLPIQVAGMSVSNRASNASMEIAHFSFGGRCQYALHRNWQQAALPCLARPGGHGRHRNVSLLHSRS